MPLNKNILEIYSDYLLVSFAQTTSTGLSSILDGQLSHDKISRFLGGNYQENNKLQYTEYTSKDLWKLVKKAVRLDETEDGIIAIDDTVEEKRYTDENEVNCYHFDHCLGRNVKGINMLNFLYLGKELTIPIAFEIIKKPNIIEKKITDDNGNTKTIKRRKADKTKNEIVRENISQIVKNQVKFKYIVLDSWFACNETLSLINNHKKYYVCPIKSNRKIALSKEDKLQGKWLKLENVDNLETETPTEVWLEGLDHSVLLTKQVFTNKDESVGIMYLITNNLSLNTRNAIFEIYKKRWKIEEFYKSLKSNLSFSKAPTKNAFTQINHFFCSIYTYFKTEILTKTNNLKNHFELKSKLYFKALQSTRQELELLKGAGGCER